MFDFNFLIKLEGFFNLLFFKSIGLVDVSNLIRNFKLI